jgi:hypothetical protein
MGMTTEKLETVRKVRDQVKAGHWAKGTYCEGRGSADPHWVGCLRGNIAKAYQQRGQTISEAASACHPVELWLMRDLSADPVVVEWFASRKATNPGLAPLYVAEFWNDSRDGASKEDVIALLDRQEARYLEQLSGDPLPVEPEAVEA